MHTDQDLIDCARKTSETYTSWIHIILKLGVAASLPFSHFSRLNFKHFIEEFQNLKKSKKRTYELYSLLKADFLKQYSNFAKSINETQNCCISQDLHLMRYKQFLVRKKLFSKKIMDWKLLTQIISRERVDHFNIKPKQCSSISFKNYLIKHINLKKILEKHTFEDQENRNFQYQNSSRKLYRAGFGESSSSLSIN